MKVNIGNYKKPKAKLPRKEFVKIDSWDTYSANHTLALIIHPLLVEFKKKVEEKGVVPAEFFETIDVSELTEEEAAKLHEASWEKGKEQWLSILDNMIWSFEQIVNNYDGEEEFFKVREDVPAENVLDKYDLDQNGLNDYREKVQKGFNLFGEYYNSLWW